MRNPRLTIIQNDPDVPPGRAVRVARGHGIDVSLVALDAGDSLPDPQEVDALVVLGGEMGVYDGDRVAYLEPERQLLRELVAKGTPVLGLCLGCQLLADALGGSAYLADQPEVAFDRLVPVVPDSVVDHLVDRRSLSMHRDTWDLPPAGRLVARTQAFNGAFRVGSALGVQPHPEVDGATVTTWLSHPSGVAMADSAGVDAADVLADVVAADEEIAAAAEGFFTAWYQEAGLLER